MKEIGRLFVLALPLAATIAVMTPRIGDPADSVGHRNPIVPDTCSPTPLPDAGGNAALLPGHRIVSFYGNPRSPRMGILGRLPPDRLIEHLRTQAAAYALADSSTPVIPALHLVTVVAQKAPGAQGLYRARMPASLVEHVNSWIDPDSMLLFLDIQPGASTMIDEVRNYLPFLERPWVHLALDPEFAMSSGQVPGTRIGSIDADDVNEVIDLLATLVESRSLPPKILVIHRFTEKMLTRRERIRLDPRVQVAIVMDGFGGPPLKASSYRGVVAAQPVQFTGFKLFYEQDAPLMNPLQVLALKPSPHVIIYQ